VGWTQDEGAHGLAYPSIPCSAADTGFGERAVRAALVELTGTRVIFGGLAGPS
jgi:hypothetical protein